MRDDKLILPFEELKDLQRGQERTFDFKEHQELPRNAVLIDRTGGEYYSAERLSIQSLGDSLIAIYRIVEVY